MAKRKSAAPSEPFTWLKTWPHSDRSCSTCGKTLRVQDVGEHRAIYERGKIVQEFLWCKEHRGGRVRPGEGEWPAYAC